ncbi:hypothetical protein HYU16_02945 [Candidatus Woesearchaeota archaeon]|nr:hypothetical protein [Candidatus Woesearchaeota archaeon]
MRFWKKMWHLPDSLVYLALLARSKRGLAISDKMLLWIPRFIFTVIVVGLTFYIILSFIITKTNVSEAESNILTDVAYYSGDGFSFVDKDTNRVYAGVIDGSKFSDAQLGALLSNDKPLLVGRFVRRQTIIDYLLHPQTDAVAYTDKARYGQWQPIAQLKGEGEGGKTPYSEVRYVAVRNPATGNSKGAVVETVFIASN